MIKALNMSKFLGVQGSSCDDVGAGGGPVIHYKIHTVTPGPAVNTDLSIGAVLAGLSTGNETEKDEPVEESFLLRCEYKVGAIKVFHRQLPRQNSSRCLTTRHVMLVAHAVHLS